MSGVGDHEGTRPDARQVVVAVDGPAASGKSTAARRVAERLGFHHLNSGTLYRAIAWAALEEGWADADADEVAARLVDVPLTLEPSAASFRVRVAGEEPDSELRRPDVADAASKLSGLASVRSRVNGLVRAAGQRASLVCDGRDAGTAIFPDAELKVFLTAEPAERARRRLRDEGFEPTRQRVARAAERIAARDEADAGRELDPLRKADDALEIDTTSLSPAEVVDRIVEEAVRRGLVDAEG